MIMKSAVVFFLALVAITVSKVNALKILGIFPYQGKSHFFVFEPYLRELSRRGHDVTVISYFPQKQSIQNYTDITLTEKENIYEDIFNVEQDIFSIIEMTNQFVENSLVNCKVLLENENVQNLWKYRVKFDLVVTEAFFGDCSLGLAYKIGAPVISLTSHLVLPQHYDRFALPYKFLQLSPSWPPSVLQRLGLTLTILISKILMNWAVQANEQAILATYFDDIPPLEELGREVKLLLAYTHYSMFGPKALSENVKEVGGYHVAEPKPLPDELREFIEQAEHGVVFISFGSMVKSASISKEKFAAITAALAQLPQRVVWKWEEDSFPGNPKNIYVARWLPQNDILAHPNVIAFFSHCGLLGTTEAFHHGVPIVGMPVFGDQFNNVEVVEEKGFGVKIQFYEITKETLLDKLKTVLDPEFQRRAKEISREWHDRPMSPMDTAIYWTEYAVRHPNSTLKIPAVGKPSYQLLGLDMLLTLIVIFLVPIIIVKYLICGRKKTKSKKE